MSPAPFLLDLEKRQYLGVARVKQIFILLTSSSRAPYFVFEQLMEKLNFDSSFKNIPMPDNTS